MKRLALGALSGLTLFSALPAAHAAQSAHCLIEVEGKTYLRGPCPVMKMGTVMMVGSDGEQSLSPYFAQISINPDGTADGRWSAVPKSTHAQTPLGTLRRSGSCWENPVAKVCAE